MASYYNITKLPERVAFGLHSANAAFISGETSNQIVLGAANTPYITITNGKISGLSAPTNADEAVNLGYLTPILSNINNAIGQKDNYVQWLLNAGTSYTVTSQKEVRVASSGSVSTTVSQVENALLLTVAHNQYSGTGTHGHSTTGTVSADGGTLSIPYLSVSDGHISTISTSTVTLSTPNLNLVGAEGNAIDITNQGGASVLNLISHVAVSGHNITLETAQVSLPSAPSIVVANGANISSISGRTLTTIGSLSATGHTITVTPVEITLPAETPFTSTITEGDALTPAHGETISVLTNGSSTGHALTLTRQNITLPAQITGGGNVTNPASVGFGRTVNYINSVSVVGDALSVTNASFTLPTETPVSASVESTATGEEINATFGGNFEVVTGVTSVSGHSVVLQKSVVTLPTPQEVSIPNVTISESAASVALNILAQAVNFEAYTASSANGHEITLTKTNFSIPRVEIPTIPSISVTESSSDVTVPATGIVSLVSDISATGHTITENKANLTIGLYKEASTGTGSSVALGGSFNAVTDVNVSGLKVQPVITPITISQIAGGSGSVTNQTPAFGQAVNIITGVSLSGTGQLTVTTGNFMLPTPAVATDRNVSQTFLAATDTNARGLLLAGAPNSTGGTYWSSNITATASGNLSATNLNAAAQIRGKDLYLTGNLYVGGNTTTIDISNISTKDYLIELAKGRDADTAITNPVGIYASNYDGTANAGGLIFDSTGTARVGDITINAETGMIDDATSAQAILTRDEADAMGASQVLIWNATAQKASTSGFTIATSVPPGAVFTDTISTVTGGTMLTVANSSRNYTVSHNAVSFNGTPTPATASPGFGGSFTVIDGITEDGYGHVNAVTRRTITLPPAPTFTETKLSLAGTPNATLPAGNNLTHGGNFSIISNIAVSNHAITITRATLNMPAETQLSGGGSVSLPNAAVNFGTTINALRAISVSGHVVTVGTGNFTLPTLSAVNGTASGTASTVVTGISVAQNGRITATRSTIPSVIAAAANAQTPVTNRTFTVVTGITASGHTITPQTTQITVPITETVIADTLAYLGTNYAYSGSETTAFDVLVPETSTSAIGVSGTALAFKKARISLTPHSTSLSVNTTLNSSPKQLSHDPNSADSNFTVVTAVNGSGTNINVSSQTFKLPNTSAIESAIAALQTAQNNYVTVTADSVQTILSRKIFNDSLTVASTGAQATYYGTVSGAANVPVISLYRTGSTNSIGISGSGAVRLAAGGATQDTSVSTGVTINSAGNVRITANGGSAITMSAGAVNSTNAVASYHVYKNSTGASSAWTKYNENTAAIDFVFA